MRYAALAKKLVTIVQTSTRASFAVAVLLLGACGAIDSQIAKSICNDQRSPTLEQIRYVDGYADVQGAYRDAIKLIVKDGFRFVELPVRAHELGSGFSIDDGPREKPAFSEAFPYVRVELLERGSSGCQRFDALTAVQKLAYFEAGVPVTRCISFEYRKKPSALYVLQREAVWGFVIVDRYKVVDVQKGKTIYQADDASNTADVYSLGGALVQSITTPYQYGCRRALALSRSALKPLPGSMSLQTRTERRIVRFSDIKMGASATARAEVLPSFSWLREHFVDRSRDGVQLSSGGGIRIAVWRYGEIALIGDQDLVYLRPDSFVYCAAPFQYANHLYTLVQRREGGEPSVGLLKISADGKQFTWFKILDEATQAPLRVRSCDGLHHANIMDSEILFIERNALRRVDLRLLGAEEERSK